jgi:hypothetical protein
MLENAATFTRCVPRYMLRVVVAGAFVACSGGGSAGHAGGASSQTARSRDAAAAADGEVQALSPSEAATAAAPSADPTSSSRDAVAAAIAANPACQNIKPFYWEIGDRRDRVLSGSVGTGYMRTTEMEIASASKWLYSAYYVQKTAGALEPDGVPFLNFTSGYASISGACLGRTVQGCNRYMMNAAPGTTDTPGADRLAVDRFDYNAGHLEAHAERYGGLGADTASTLGKDILSQLGPELHLSYDNPLLAGGGRMSSEQYALFLQKILRGDLKIGDLLGSHAVCTLSSDYAALFNEQCDAVFSPWWPAASGKLADTSDASLVQNVHYSLGHWVEADGAFSSPGLFGFYPWITGDKQWYGLIGRRQLFKVFDEAHPDTSAYAQSVRCGQAIRAAWLEGR